MSLKNSTKKKGGETKMFKVPLPTRAPTNEEKSDLFIYDGIAYSFEWQEHEDDENYDPFANYKMFVVDNYFGVGSPFDGRLLAVYYPNNPNVYAPLLLAWFKTTKELTLINESDRATNLF